MDDEFYPKIKTDRQKVIFSRRRMSQEMVRLVQSCSRNSLDTGEESDIESGGESSPLGWKHSSEVGRRVGHSSQQHTVRLRALNKANLENNFARENPTTSFTTNNMEIFNNYLPSDGGETVEIRKSTNSNNMDDGGHWKKSRMNVFTSHLLSNKFHVFCLSFVIFIFYILPGDLLKLAIIIWLCVRFFPKPKIQQNTFTAHLQFIDIPTYSVQEGCIYLGSLRQLKTSYEPSLYHKKQTTLVSVMVKNSGMMHVCTVANDSMQGEANLNKSDGVELNSERIYNLKGADVFLLPEQLARRREFTYSKISKKNFVSLPNLSKDFQCAIGKESNDDEVLYFFAKNNREKEHLKKVAGTFSKTVDRNCHSDSECISSGSDHCYANLNNHFSHAMQQTYENFMNSVMTKHEERTNRRYIELNDCRRFAKIADRTHADSSHTVQQSLNWLNVIISRIFFSLSTEQTIVEAIMGEIQKKLLVMSISPIFDTIKLISFNLGKTSPVIHSVDDPPTRDFWGLWFDFEIQYSGQISIVIETKLNVSKNYSNSCEQVQKNAKKNYCDENIPESGDSSSEEESSRIISSGHRERIKKFLLYYVAPAGNYQHTKYNKIFDKLAKIAGQPITLAIEVTHLKGRLVVNLPSPPTDRIWYAFRNEPEITFQISPKFGQHSVNLNPLTDIIKNRLKKMINKKLVIPNMDNIIIPYCSASSMTEKI
ncbi:Testis-expressed sequence 2 protein [Trichinella patagoniensis]|uniref:Testis-expressed sequence 2 protein n=1 Tax=Trichinella patagoniensis TaxID=990121 RepID=A0A0V0ZN90_9BILA|nr:Testis-expressed sequence 2 protein [Trichinella patagoniensis]